MLIYTAVFSKPDVLFNPTLPLPDIDKLCFTDMELQGESAYQAVSVQLDDSSGRRCQRRVKLYWPDIFNNYEYSLYLDSNVTLKADPRRFINMLTAGSDILVFRHCRRDCLYEEAQVCLDYGLAEQDAIARQLEKYRVEGYPEHHGLFQGTIIFRRHTEAMREFSKAWLKEVMTFTARDQISFPYVVWKLKEPMSLFSSSILANPWFCWKGEHNSWASQFVKRYCRNDNRG